MEEMFGIQARVGMEVRGGGERQNFKKNGCFVGPRNVVTWGLKIIIGEELG